VAAKLSAGVEARRKILPAQAPLIDRLLESPLVYSRR
jgi:hypothetical protein